MYKFLFLIFSTALFSTEIDKSFLLYLLHKNQIGKCISNYQVYSYENNEDDYTILGEIGMSLLEKGIDSDDIDTQTLSLLGASLSANMRSFDILKKGFLKKEPKIQMLALHFLSRIEDERVDDLLIHAMRSPYLPIRMEAAFYLSEKKHSHAVGQVEALMHRLPAQFRPFFPSLFALNGTNEAIAIMKRLIHDPNTYVRIESIHALLKHNRDDFLPTIRKRLVASSSQEKEICCLAAGFFQDKESIPKLEKLSLSKNSEISLAAMKALYLLGKTSYQTKIESLALTKNLFAINALSELKGSEDTLYILTFDRDIQVRINATYALLKRKDPRVVEKIEELLFHDQRELAFAPVSSLGKAHMAFRCISNSYQDTKNRRINLPLSFAIKEKFLEEAMYLDYKTFLKIAEKLFKKEQNPLIPQLVALLQNLKGTEAIDLLKKYAHKPGAPLIRTYCQLALFKLKEDGPYQEKVFQFIEKNINHELIELQPILSWNERVMEHSYRLTNKETTQLLVDCFSALAERKNKKSIHCILDAIKSGNPKNRYALAGLLLRAVE